jgi:predicted HTH transcriptional regulator
LLSLPVGEFDWIEVKERKKIDITLPNVDENVVRRELAKQLSAFANSGGGFIVYGLENVRGQDRNWIVSDGGIPLGIRGTPKNGWRT